MAQHIDRFEIIDHGSPRPEAERIIFCDGTGGSIFQPKTDLELSHWRPNQTRTGPELRPKSASAFSVIRVLALGRLP